MFETLLLTGVFISLLAGQFARVELINSLANVYVHEFLLLIYICFSYFQYGIMPIKIIFKTKSIFIFCVIAVISFMLPILQFNTHQNVIAFLYLARMMLYGVFGMYLFSHIQRVKKIKNMVRQLIFTFSVLLLVITAIQFLFFPNFWGLYALGWDPHLYRASAGYLDIFIAAALYGLLAFYWFIKRQYILSLLFIVALVLSFSRSAYIAFICALMYFFIFKNKWKLLIVSLVFFLAFIFFVPKPFGEGGNLLRTASINSRILDYKRGIALWQKRPIFGYGYNRIRFAKEQVNLAQVDDVSHSLSSFHSSFLIILVTTGIVGFLSFLFLLGHLFKKCPQLRVFIVYILVMSLFDNVLLHVLVILPMLFIAGVLSQSSLE